MKSPTQRSNPSTASDPRWQAVLAHDAAADGRFYYAVKTTGVYCRPSCAARTPRPENVSFYVTQAEAEAAGYRACKRCRPGAPSLAERHAAAVARACRLIESSETLPDLGTLAEHVHLSIYHFHRVFKAATGVTPKAYAAAHRAKQVRNALARGDQVTRAMYDAGYGSSGRFYEQADAVLGMRPSQFRAGGANEVIRHATARCSLGTLLVAASARGVCAILMGANAAELMRDLKARFSNAEIAAGDKAFARTVKQVVGLIEAPGKGTALPLDVRGTAFQQRVWQALRAIPAGSTASYAEVARRIGAPGAARAVAGACAANALAVAIPCHRVVRSGGALAGYRWGVARKKALLAREAR